MVPGASGGYPTPAECAFISKQLLKADRQSVDTSMVLGKVRGLRAKVLALLFHNMAAAWIARSFSDSYSKSSRGLNHTE
jgi:hypothetical protein